MITWLTIFSCIVLMLLAVLDLSSNDLTGTFPNQLGSFPFLHEFNLGNSNLTGNVDLQFCINIYAHSISSTVDCEAVHW